MTRNPSPRALVVVPAHNEEASLPNALRQLQRLSNGVDILVIDDGSTDKTRRFLDQLDLAESICVRTLGLAASCGIGAAVQAGYRYAAQMGCYDYVIQYDADGQHDAAAVFRLMQACQSHGWDLAVGSRFLAAERAGQERPPADAPGPVPYRSTAARRLGMRMIDALLAWRTGQAFTDPTSGFRCAGRRAVALFARQYADDFPEPESLLAACRAGLACGEIRVRMFARAAGKSSIGWSNSLYYMVRAVVCLVVGPVERDAGNSWCPARRLPREPECLTSPTGPRIAATGASSARRRRPMLHPRKQVNTPGSCPEGTEERPVGGQTGERAIRVQADTSERRGDSVIPSVAPAGATCKTARSETRVLRAGPALPARPFTGCCSPAPLAPTASVPGLTDDRIPANPLCTPRWPARMAGVVDWPGGW